MKRYEEMEHTADLKVRIHGRDLPELFANASWALAELLAQPGERALGVEKALTLEGEDYPMLLVEWLGRLLYLWETEELLFVAEEVAELSPRRLSTTLVAFEPKELKREIKAVTYHDLEIREVGGSFQATVVFDI